eukprot:11187130-Lingulodinium_polyedra.AAC.1
MDERNDRLLVTYAACRGTTVSSGVLAQLRSPGRSADRTVVCVAAAARRFCTVRQPRPRVNKVSKDRKGGRRQAVGVKRPAQPAA